MTATTTAAMYAAIQNFSTFVSAHACDAGKIIPL